MGKGNACDVCGGSETRLVDGFYYCAECGTQDTNVRETVVEHTALADGTFGFFSKQKFSVKIKDGVQMSPEWHKWHAYNFIMAGLTGELLRLGAAPSFKTKVLWIWAKYIKKYQDKEKMFNNNVLSEIRNYIEDSDHSEQEQKLQRKREQDMSHHILVAILNIALNLDRSNIQLSHLRRFITSGHLGIDKCKEYVPKEIDTRCIPGWVRTLLMSKHGRYSWQKIAQAMKKFFDLVLGTYLTPNVDWMVDNQLKELCLPNDMKHLVLSLMDYAPVDYLNGDKKSQALPDFEGIVMAYILVALKMCFGLDDDYEIRLSEAVDKINDEENHLKVYKLDMFSEPSGRLFSFREWCNYLLFRKYLHCKYNSSMAKERGLYLDDYVFMEHSEPKTKEVLLSDEVTMDIINKIPQNNDFDVIPKSKFVPSVTPLSTATDTICNHLRDLEARRILSEDFSQYSINYACRDLTLSTTSGTSENIIIGVSESGKTYNDLLGLHFKLSYSDDTMVYVRNCENKNWFKTKRPTSDHIVKVKEPNDRESDHGYDSNLENTPGESNMNEIQVRTIHGNTESTSVEGNPDTNADTDDEESKDTKLEVFEEDSGDNIFDDDFLDMNTEETKFADTIQNLDSTFNDTMPTLRFEDSYYEENDLEDSKVGDKSISLIDDVESEPKFDPTTFDRESTIKELVIAACRKYKVPLPSKYRNKKRKLGNPTAEATVPKPKRPKTRPDAAKLMEKKEKRADINEIITAYYRNLGQDIMHEFSQHIKSFVDNIGQQNLTNDSVEHIDPELVNENNVIEQSDNIIENNEIGENESDDGTIQDPIYKGDAKFDEKTHDAKQLYLKVKGEFETEDLFDIDSDEEINKLLDEQINNPRKSVDAVESDNDSDDLSFSTHCNSKKRLKLKKLIPNREIGEFNYWFKHYISRIFKRHELLEKFDTEVKDTFPKSFGFVLFECAAVLDCSAHSLYLHMTDIEEKMLKRDGYVRTKKSLQDTGIRIERRDYKTRNIRTKSMVKKK